MRTTVVQRVPPLRYMHLRGILWVIFRVPLVGFGLFGPGAARAPFVYFRGYILRVLYIEAKVKVIKQ